GYVRLVVLGSSPHGLEVYQRPTVDQGRRKIFMSEQIVLVPGRCSAGGRIGEEQFSTSRPLLAPQERRRGLAVAGPCDHDGRQCPAPPTLFLELAGFRSPRAFVDEGVKNLRRNGGGECLWNPFFRLAVVCRQCRAGDVR